MVSGFGSSIVRVNVERADGGSSLASFRVVVGWAAALAVVLLLVMLEPSWSWLESVLVYWGTVPSDRGSPALGGRLRGWRRARGEEDDAKPDGVLAGGSGAVGDEDMDPASRSSNR